MKKFSLRKFWGRLKVKALIIFNSAFAAALPVIEDSLPTLVSMLQSQMPSIQEFFPENIYKATGIFVVACNILIGVLIHGDEKKVEVEDDRE